LYTIIKINTKHLIQFHSATITIDVLVAGFGRNASTKQLSMVLC
jgi:hypothetical protein